MGDGVQDEVGDPDPPVGHAATAHPDQECQDHEDHQSLIGSHRLVGDVEAGGEAVGVGVGGGPGQVGGVAEDVPVDDVSDPADRLPDRGQEHAGIQQHPEVHPLAPGHEEQGEAGQEDGPEEGHATLPDSEGLERVGEVVGGAGLEVVEQSSPDQSHDDGPEGDPSSL